MHKNLINTENQSPLYCKFWQSKELKLELWVSHQSHGRDVNLADEPCAGLYAARDELLICYSSHVYVTPVASVAVPSH